MTKLRVLSYFSIPVLIFVALSVLAFGVNKISSLNEVVKNNEKVISDLKYDVSEKSKEIADGNNRIERYVAQLKLFTEAQAVNEKEVNDLRDAVELGKRRLFIKAKSCREQGEDKGDTAVSVPSSTYAEISADTGQDYYSLKRRLLDADARLVGWATWAKDECGADIPDYLLE